VRAFEDNAGLSRERAGEVAEYFKTVLELPPEAISYEWAGDTQPIASNASAEGRAQARRLGEWFAQRRLTPAVVRSSRWCRCIDTAQLAFGRAQPDDALNSFFDNPDAGPAQTATSRTLLARIPPGTFEVWVTHQVNASALTGEWLAMGEALVVVSADGGGSVRVVARLLVP
jgi:broad specificity phosphatase PhoE